MYKIVVFEKTFHSTRVQTELVFVKFVQQNVTFHKAGTISNILYMYVSLYHNKTEWSPCVEKVLRSDVKKKKGLCTSKGK